MADPFISFLLQRIGTLIDDKVRFLSGVRGQIKRAEAELRLMRAYLKEADKLAAQGDSQVRIWIAEIREVFCDLEDLFMTLEERRKKGRSMMKRIHIGKRVSQLYDVGSELKRITDIISGVTSCLDRYGIKQTEPSNGEIELDDSIYLSKTQKVLRSSVPFGHEDDFVYERFQNDINHLVAKLITQENSDIRVISICGMGGLGKTTLARQIFRHMDVRSHFELFAWVQISPQCQPKDVLLKLLKDLKPSQHVSIGEMDVTNLAGELNELQRQRRCLVILDDIWSHTAWNSLKFAFPVTITSGSKIVLTTRNKEVASRVDLNSFIHEPQRLQDNESWEFFRIEAYFERQQTNLRDREKMRELGREMLPYCGGLPLAIAVLRGLLSTRDTVEEWDTIRKNVRTCIRTGQIAAEAEHGNFDGVSWLLNLSYDDLSFKLKRCFLHFAHFSKDSNLRVKELCRMWMAEGIALSEDEAHEYFRKLVQRYMIQVEEKGSTGSFKTYRIHDLIRDLCLSRAQDENFLRLHDFKNRHGATDGSSESSCNYKVRRIAIYLNNNTDYELLPLIRSTDNSLRSFICFNPTIKPSYEQVMKALLPRFRLLRVLKFENLNRGSVGKLPEEIGELVHLRLLSLKESIVTKLPSSIGNLKYLQTLDLRTNWKSVFPKEMRKLKQLRHLYLPQKNNVKSKELQLDDLSNLRTLVNVSMKLCDLKDLAKLPELMKLKICEWSTYSSNIQFNKIQSLAVHDSSVTTPVKIGPIISSCPQIAKLHLELRVEWRILDISYLSSNLKKLIFRATYIQQDPMGTLQKLKNLKILHFEDNAFIGDQLNCDMIDGFPALEFLRFNKLEKSIELRMNRGACANLRDLSIVNCPNFKRLDY